MRPTPGVGKRSRLKAFFAQSIKRAFVNAISPTMRRHKVETIELYLMSCLELLRIFRLYCDLLGALYMVRLVIRVGLLYRLVMLVSEIKFVINLR